MEKFFDTIPIILAVYFLLVSTSNFSIKRRRSDNIITALSCLSAILLIIAQTSWWIAITSGVLQDTWLANSVWTIFNSVVMITFILFGKSRTP